MRAFCITVKKTICIHIKLFFSRKIPLDFGEASESRVELKNAQCLAFRQTSKWYILPFSKLYDVIAERYRNKWSIKIEKNLNCVTLRNRPM